MDPKKPLSFNSDQDQFKDPNNTENQPPESYTGTQMAGVTNPTNETLAPPAGTPASAAQPTQPQQPKKHSKRWRIAFIAGLSLLLIGGGTALAYFAYYLPNRPENILKAALANSFSPETVSSVSFKGDFYTNDVAVEDKSNGSFTGVVDRGGGFDIKVDIDATITTLSVNVRSVDGKKGYLKIGGLSGLAELLEVNSKEEVQFYSALFASLDDQWFEINESLVENFSGGLTDSSNESYSQIADIYNQHPFLEVREALSDEQIDGVNSHHYKIGLNEQQLEGFLRDINDANLANFTGEQLQNFLDGLKKIDSIDIWIDKDTKMFTQFAFASVNEQNTEFSAKLTITGYNEPVKIEEPEDARSILELLGDVFGQEGDVQGEMDLIPWLEGELAPHSL